MYCIRIHQLFIYMFSFFPWVSGSQIKEYTWAINSGVRVAEMSIWVDNSRDACPVTWPKPYQSIACRLQIRIASTVLYWKPSTFGKQFCITNTAIVTSYITFQSNQKKIFRPRKKWIYDILVPDPGKGVCADPVNRGAILEGRGPGPPGGNKERQLSPDKGRGKTWQHEKMAGSQGRLPLHGFKMRACTE